MSRGDSAYSPPDDLPSCFPYRYYVRKLVNSYLQNTIEIKLLKFLSDIVNPKIYIYLVNCCSTIFTSIHYRERFKLLFYWLQFEMLRVHWSARSLPNKHVVQPPGRLRWRSTYKIIFYIIITPIYWSYNNLELLR